MNIREKLASLYPSISAFFITHPRMAWVVAIVITLVGAISFTRLAVAEYPNITPVTITVSATYTGASTQVLNDSVGQIIEDQINGVEDIWYYKSNCNDR
ncbi:MAG: efflux RND transporter permease subunit [Kiritimatiellae bacterium]|nr:efflux RND transporter permease subunit [Kiritimatiellia bacterium]